MPNRWTQLGTLELKDRNISSWIQINFFEYLISQKLSTFKSSYFGSLLYNIYNNDISKLTAKI